MPAYFGLDDDGLKEKLLGVLQRAGLEAETFWDSIIPDANRAAYDDIRNALAIRGYLPEQIEEWDSGPTYQTDLALFWCLVKGGCTQAYDDKFIRDLDRREMLQTVPVIVDDEVIQPDPTDKVPKVGLGVMKRSDDVFSMDTKW